MIYRHIAKKCNGEVDTKSRTCLRCKKHWNWFTFMFSPLSIRMDPKGKPATEAVRKVALGKTDYAKWADKYEKISWVASHLPKWPRWARILATVIVVGGLSVGLYYLWHFIWNLF